MKKTNLNQFKFQTHSTLLLYYVNVIVLAEASTLLSSALTFIFFKSITNYNNLFKKYITYLYEYYTNNGVKL
jgi:hypothetical protein